MTSASDQDSPSPSPSRKREGSFTPRILIIAGSDSGGGAGIQADIKTVTMLGGHAMTAITAITAQNTLGVQAVMPVPTDMVIAQIESCVSDIGVDAVKIGMIGSAETAHAVADWLEGFLSPSPSGEGLGWGGAANPAPPLHGDAPPPPPPLKGSGLRLPIVFDPVMVATSGDTLADAATIAAFERLMRIASVVTPNTPELERLSGLTITSEEDQGAAAEAVMQKTGVEAVLAKGGHAVGDQSFYGGILDKLYMLDADGWRETFWEEARIATTSTHGTGCTLASAIAIFLAEGRTLGASVHRARQFVRLALHDAPGLGGGQGPMGHHKVRLDLGSELRLNQVTLGADDPAASTAFYRTLGLNQIVATDDGHYARFEAPGGATLSIEQGAAPTVFLECDDLDAEVARLQAAGLAFDHLPQDQEWLWREARLSDPAGNTICLYQAGENRRYPPWRLPDA